MLLRFDDGAGLSLSEMFTPWLARAEDRDGCSGRLLEFPTTIVF